MGFKKKTGKGRLDKYYHYAKEQGYRARSAFKLIQLNKKYDFLSSARCVIDLCAAPGGWLQVAAKSMPVESLIVGVDLAPIRPIPNCITFQDDITTPSCRNQLRGHLKTWKADVVLHDGAPNVGSAWAQDAFSQSELVLESLKLAVEFLRKGGVFVTKVFRSKDYNNLMWVFNQLFTKVEATKPPSSRNVSAEIFVVCQNFIAPKKIDPKFLDIKYVFKDLDGDIKDGKVSSSLNIFEPSKHKRQRDGYAEGATTLFKSDDIMELINNDDPISYLATRNQLRFDSEEAKNLLKLKVTHPEIIASVEDLKVLGKREFRDLLRWRTSVLEIIKPKPEPKSETTVEVVEESLEDELARLANEEKVKEKKIKRKLLEKRQKELMKLQLSMTTPVEIGNEQIGMSAFTSANSQKGVGRIVDADMDGEEFLVDSDEDIVVFGGEGSESEDREEDEYDSDTEHLEASVNEMYKQYKERRQTRKEALRAKPEYEEWNGIEENRNSDSDSANEEDKAAHARRLNEDSDSDSDFESEQESGEEKEGTLSGKAALWFDQPIFKEFTDSDKNSNSVQSKSDKKRKVQDVEEDEDDESIISDQDLNDSDEDSDEPLPEDDPDQKEKEAKSRALNLTTPEAMTLAMKLVNREITKTDLISNSFNRNSFNDVDELPAWFREDEKKHFKHNIPITKEAAAAIKERLKALDARPIKKVAEAKARKKFKAAQKISKLQKKASIIADSNDMTEQEKARSIEKVMAKKGSAKKQQQRKVQLVVARGSNRGNPGRPSGVKGRYKMVDSRMKKELRATKRIAKKSGKKRR